MHTKSLPSRQTLCNPMDHDPPGPSVLGILQARILEWVAIPSSRGSSGPRDRTWVSCIAGGFFTDESTGEVHGCGGGVKAGLQVILMGFRVSRHFCWPFSCSSSSPATQNLFYNKMLNVSCNLLNIVLKVKNRMVVWVQNDSKCIGCLPS